MSNSDIILIGGGIAGLSAAAALSRHARVRVLEAEEQIGFHSSGRSTTMVHYALGDRLVRALTLASRPFFDSPPEGFSDAQLATMRRGSVIVDLAAEAGGNVEGTVSGEHVEKHGVTIIGASNLARSLAADASALFARNLYNFLSAFWDKEQGRPVLPDDDEIVKAIRVTQGGKIVNDRLTQ